ncbi:MAG: 3-oxoacyl-[acyl-carrier-protein] synthase III C-terminal domain-containing protein [Stackebrandtia sp.]
MHAYVDHLVYALGDRRVNVAESQRENRLLSTATDLAAAGFGHHHVCGPGTTAYDLARNAVGRLPRHVLSTGFDAIVYATCLPLNGNVGDADAFSSTRDVSDLMEFPVSRLQSDFALDHAIGVGLNQQGCTSMLGSLRIARALLATEPDWQRILCVTADRFPDGAVYEQAYNVISDGAAACVVSRQPSGFRILANHQITNGGMAASTDDERVGSYFSYTDLLVKETLRRADLSMADISWVVPQNTNQNAWKILARLLGIGVEQVCQPTIREVGHAISADNVVNLSSLIQSGRIRAGERILLLMAGHGLNWQSTILESMEDIE